MIIEYGQDGNSRAVINYLNQNVWVRLDTTEHGVGVRAIRDIPKNTRITDYDEENKNLSMKFLIIDIDELILQSFRLNEKIFSLLKDRYYFPISGNVRLCSPNCHQMIRMYINHNSNSNVDKNLTTTKDVSEGEEIFFNYKDIIPFENTHSLSKEHFFYASDFTSLVAYRLG